MDQLDRTAEKSFPGYLVRKDLVRRYARQYPVPTYVVEFLLGRYCASTDPREIDEGLAIVQKQLQGRTVRSGEQELFKARAKELVGHREPRAHEYSIQVRPFDADKSGVGLGLPVLVAMTGGLLERSTRGGTVIVGPLNLGGSIELIPNPVAIAELAVDKQAATLLVPVAARRALNELPDDLWTKIRIEFYSDAADAVFKALLE